MPRSAIIESKRGQAPPSRIPPLSGTLGAPAAHRSASEAEARGLGKTDSHARRSRVFRPLAIESKRGQAPPSRIPPLSGTLGAPAAHRSASEAEARGLGKTDSHARRSRVFRPLAIESKRGQAPPSRIPPLSGTLGAPAAHRSASEAEARGLGKTDSHARRSRVFRPLAIESKRGQAPPSRIPPLSGTLGAPAAHRSASEAEARGLGKTDSHARRSRVFRPLAIESKRGQAPPS